MPLTEDQVRQQLEQVRYPGFSRSIVSFGLVQDISVVDGKVRVVIEHTIDDGGVLERIRRDCQSALESMSDVAGVEIALQRKGETPAPQTVGVGPGAGSGLPGIKSVIAVASAKGGVGKSTVATNLALALNKLGMKTGLLDADIYGPSLPTMMGIDERPTITDDKKMIPLEKDGLKLISIGFLVPPDKAMIWRGPMVMGAVQQFLRDCIWGELDVLVVDLPPGTGDAQLTLVQQVPLAGVVMVTTPQEVALIDVVRGIQMFETTHAPVIGVIENMSGFACPSCGHETEIFGKGGGKRTSDRYGVPFLGAVPIDPVIRESGDAGRPVVLSHPESASATALMDCADTVVRFLQSRSATPAG